MKYVKQGLSNWSKPSGRSSRVEYWLTFLFFFFLGLVLIFTSEALYYLISLVSLLIGIGLGIRRMHDAGVSGWFLLVPVANLVYAFSKSEQKENKWGPVPNESLDKRTNINIEDENFCTIDEDYDVELLELEERLAELQKLKQAQVAADLEKNSRKEEILKEIEYLRKELDEQG